MQTPKDTSFNIDLLNFRPQPKKSPNILKKRTDPSTTSAFHSSKQSNGSSKPCDRLPVSKTQRAKSEKEVEVLFLHQSDFADVSSESISTGDDTVTVMVDSILQKTKVKEIVVDESQIFQLKTINQGAFDQKTTGRIPTNQKDDSGSQSVKTNRVEMVKNGDGKTRAAMKINNKMEFVDDIREKLLKLPKTYSKKTPVDNTNKPQTSKYNEQEIRTAQNIRNRMQQSICNKTTVNSIDDEIQIISDDDTSESGEKRTLSNATVDKNKASTLREAKRSTPDRPVTPTMPISVCRTCLRQFPSSTCHKLFDCGRYHRKSYDLRQRLSEVADFIDFKACVDPVICSECYHTINSAYMFRVRAKAVEQQIKKKKNETPSMVDLKAFLEEIAKEKAEMKKKLKEVNTRKPGEHNLEQYLEKRKRIIHQYVSLLEVDEAQSKKLPRHRKREEHATPNKTTEEPIDKTPIVTNGNSETDEQQLSIKVLENILVNSEKDHAIIEIVDDEDDECGNTNTGESNASNQNPESFVQNPEETVPCLQTTTPHATISSLGAFAFCTDTPTPNPDITASITICPDSNQESAISTATAVTATVPVAPVPGPQPVLLNAVPLTMPQVSLVSNLNSAHPELNYFISTEESVVPDLASSVVSISYPASPALIPEVLKPVQSESMAAVAPLEVVPIRSASPSIPDSVPVVSRPPIEETRALTMDAFLKLRQEKFRAITGCQQIGDGLEKTPEVVPNLINDLDEGKKKKSQEAYDYLFTLSGSRKKKPMVPKTWNLFDAEHDDYFKNLRGEAGCYMVRKWQRLGRRPPDFGEPPYLCENCGNFFTDRTKLKQHMDQHKGLDVTICSYCGVKIKSYRLNEHVLTRHKPPSFECQDCGKKFHLKHLLQNHISIVHKHPNQRYQCQVCGVMLKKNSMNIHMKRHNSSWKFCDICRKPFPNEVSWYMHRKLHFRTKVYTCPICSKAIKSQLNLNKHMKAFHESEETKCCSVCGKYLSKRESLARHMRRKHAWKPRNKPRKQKEIPQTFEEDQLEQVTNFIDNELTETEDRMISGIRGELPYEDIMDPMDVEEIVVPFGTVDELFPVN